MKPYYERNGIVIYNADCRDVLPTLAAGSVDLVLTDPPYGLGIANNPFRQKYERQAWDDAAVNDLLLRQVISIGKQSIVWGGNFFGLPANQCFLVWDKLQSQNFSSSMCEQAWTNLKMPAKIYRKFVASYEKFHPTQKPVDLMRWCFGFVPSAKSALDTFMGVGTTLRAAKDMGIDCIGIEIEERYCEIAARRLSQEVMELGICDQEIRRVRQVRSVRRG
jgi:site-specific DNA-methyltransferase (adenine-specific)